ncbi:phosphatase PAP2 family protein [Hymenobacter monticola]|uniref:Phosphatase PAP2 family protein n=1 Tax=Hymenobacter monticola TaxID=1705399 RepID=A0ABY4BED2_9BACT|nr:phosphatase PAP2 family protein [Hymenobacter monticola]UOE36647.1 phosphatase PAP2 family protein [Hymenobacter monticola]
MRSGRIFLPTLLAGGLLMGTVPALAQQPMAADSAAPTTRPTLLRRSARWAIQPAGRRVLVPVLLLGAGALTTHRIELIEFDEEVREELHEHLRPVRTSIDDQLRHVPAYATVGLSLLGVKGKHSTVNQALLFALTYTINNTLTSNLKRLTHVERPQGSSFDSFPSQHTSAAFSAARFLDREYGERSVWYSVGGYAVATSVGALRVVKDNHWCSDVLAGAGVGMISTELAYWVYPHLQRLLPKGLQERAVILPYYQSGATGLSVAVVL